MIYSMLVLFTCCWGSIISIQIEDWKAQWGSTSTVQNKVWGLILLFLLHIGKDWFLESKLSVVVPQAIGISLRNRIGDSAGEFLVVVLWGWFSRHSMYLNCSFSLVSVSGLGACIPGRVWLEWSLSQPACFPCFMHLFLPVHGFLIYSRVYTQFPLWFPRIHAGLLWTVTYTLDFSLFVEVNWLLGECC